MAMCCDVKNIPKISLQDRQNGDLDEPRQLWVDETILEVG